MGAPDDIEEFGGTPRFVVYDRLGAGGFGVVYRALDRERQSVVALKTLRRMGPESLYRFKKEFRALADVAHPNLVTLYELSSESGQWFFTMELVSGVGFLRHVRGETFSDEATGSQSPTRPGLYETPPGPDPVVRHFPRPVLQVDVLRRALVQLAQGVLALHGAGMLHRDIKPSNVLVTPEERVVLLDFGLVKELVPDRSGTQDVAGTPAYMSPEQAQGVPLTEASDWYSVGAMLFEALTGRLPFSGRVLDVLRQKLDGEAPSAVELNPDTPEDLDALCRELLRRDPAARPRGADVLSRLSGEAAPPRVEGVPPPSPVRPPAPPFVGRDAQIAALRDAFRVMREGRAVVVAVQGSSGMGKSMLVRRFLDELRDRERDVVILSGRCYERETVPYKALDALVDDLSRYLKRLPSRETILPRHLPALARLFPVLAPLAEASRARRPLPEVPDAQELRRRAFAALREMLVRLADRSPLVIALDDLQWGDVDSALLLEDLMRPPDTPALLLIGCYRAEEEKTSPLLDNILPKALSVKDRVDIRSVVIGALKPEESLQLARALSEVAGPKSHERAEAIAQECGGNPYLIHELMRHVGAGGSPALTLEELIEARVSSLPAAARRLLDVAALSAVPLEVACRAALVDREADSALATLRVAHLVRTRNLAERLLVETYDDRIRRWVLAHLSEDALREYHHRLATALLASGRADPEGLAMHFLGAGDADTAAQHAASAAGQAAQALAFDRAAGLFRLALNLRGHAGPQVALLQAGLGAALAGAGRGLEAAQAYLGAARHARPEEAHDLRRQAGQHLLTSGHLDEGTRVLSDVLASLGMALPRSHRLALLSLLGHRAFIRLRGLRFRERAAQEVDRDALLRIDTCWSVAVGLSQVDMVRGADFQARHLLLALRAGEPYRVARALALEVAYVAMGGNRTRRRTQDLLRRATLLAERLDHPHALGLTTLNTGIAAWLDGRWREAREMCERGEQILHDRCTEVAWEILSAQLFGLAALFFLGEVAELARRLPAILAQAEDQGDRLRATFARVGFSSHVAWLAADDPARAREELDGGLSGWGQRGFDYLHIWARGARRDIALYSGETLDEGEGKRVAGHARGVARALDRFPQAGFIVGQDSRARWRLALAAQARSESDRAEHLRKVLEHAGAIDAEATLWGQPLALLLRASVMAERSDLGQAATLANAAEAGLAAAGMALHAAVARRRCGELAGGETGRTQVEEADAWMTAQGIRRPDRMAAMLAPGRWLTR